MGSATDAWASGAADVGVAPPIAEADIACDSTPVSVEAAVPFAANVPVGEVARLVEADAGAGAALNVALPLLDTRRAGRAAARTAALLIKGVDPAGAALVLFKEPLTCAAPAAIGSAPDAGLGARVRLIASEVLRPPAASEVAAAPCKSFAACGPKAPRTFEGTVEAAVDAVASSPAVTSTVTSCGAAPEDPALIGTSTAAFAGAADVSATGNGAPGSPAAGGTACADPAVIPAAGGGSGGGGNGDGEDLPAAGRLPPLRSPLAAVCSAGLRLGLPPASLKALAKFWPWASVAEGFAAAA